MRSPPVRTSETIGNHGFDGGIAKTFATRYGLMRTSHAWRGRTAIELGRPPNRGFSHLAEPVEVAAADRQHLPAAFQVNGGRLATARDMADRSQVDHDRT